MLILSTPFVVALNIVINFVINVLDIIIYCEVTSSQWVLITMTS